MTTTRTRHTLLATLVATLAGVATLTGPIPAATAAPSPTSSATLANPGGPIATSTHTYGTTTRSSGNWAGYVATNGTYHSSSATFVVPALGCGINYSGEIALWAGLDGLNDQTVEQTGIAGICVASRSYYRAWQENFPSPPRYLNSLAIHQGDTITATATDIGVTVPGAATDTYVLSLDNLTTHQSFSSALDVDAPNPSNSSAECIFERPTLTTPNYAPAAFSSCSADSRPITAYSLVAVNMHMVNDTPIEARTSPIAPDTSFTVTRVGQPALPYPTTDIAAPLTGQGYWMVDSSGDIATRGGLSSYGDLTAGHLNAPIRHVVPTPDGQGYWMVASDGGVFAFGDAAFYGSMGGTPLNAPVVDLAPTPDGHGYWLVASDGGVFAFGDATFAGSLGATHLVAPIVGIATDPATGGYWLVAADDGIFSYHAPFFGSTGGHILNSPIVAISALPSGMGYRTVAGDGGVFAFGDATFAGSLATTPLTSPVVGIAASSSGNGYWLVTADGAVSPFGDAPDLG